MDMFEIEPLSQEMKPRISDVIDMLQMEVPLFALILVNISQILQK